MTEGKKNSHKVVNCKLCYVHHSNRRTDQNFGWSNIGNLFENSCGRHGMRRCPFTEHEPVAYYFIYYLFYLLDFIYRGNLELLREIARRTAGEF